MLYEPMAAKEYQNGGEIRNGYGDLRRKFFDEPLREIAEQCARDHKTALSLRNRVQSQHDEIATLIEQSRAYQAQISDLRQDMARMQDVASELARRKEEMGIGIQTDNTVISFKVAIEAVAQVYNLTPQVIKGPSRYQQAAAARRHVVHILTTWRTDLSLPLIGKLLGNRDHSTILHARNTWATVAPKYERQVVAVNRLLGIPLGVDNAHKSETDRPHADDLGTDCSGE